MPPLDQEKREDGVSIGVSYRAFRKPLIFAFVVASFGFAAARPADASATDAVLKAAQKEGKLVIGIPLGQAFPKLMAVFQKAYPQIAVQATSIHTGNFTARLQEERANKKYLWDAFIGGPSVGIYRLADAGAFVPIKPLILDKSIMDDGKWLYGFDAGFSDKGRNYAYNFGVQRSSGAFYVNRDVIPVSELRSVADLVKTPAKFKGKVAWQDPRGAGSGVNSAALIMRTYGEKALRDLYREADVVPTDDQRQLIEWVIRGRYPIGVGLLERELKVTFQSTGIGKDVKEIDIPDVEAAFPGSDSIVAVAEAPDPNAQKIFVNWLLSRDGQAAFAKLTLDNSRRLDVPVSDPETMPDKTRKTLPLNTQSEAFAPERIKANKISQEMLK